MASSPPTDTKFILLLGEASSGKTTWINNVAGLQLPVSTDPTQPCTKEPVLIQTRFNNEDYTIVDTPGVAYDTPTKDLFFNISQLLVTATESHVWPITAILYFRSVKNYDTRPSLMFRQAEDYCFENFYPNNFDNSFVTLVTTGWELDDGINAALEILAKRDAEADLLANDWRVAKIRNAIHTRLLDTTTKAARSLFQYATLKSRRVAEPTRIRLLTEFYPDIEFHDHDRLGERMIDTLENRVEFEEKRELEFRTMTRLGDHESDNGHFERYERLARIRRKAYESEIRKISWVMAINGFKSFWCKYRVYVRVNVILVCANIAMLVLGKSKDGK